MVTGKARSSIRHFLKHQHAKEAVDFGYVLLEKSLLEQGIVLREIPLEKQQAIAQMSGCQDMNHLVEQIGLGNQLLPIVTQRFIEHLSDQKPSSMAPGGDLVIKGTEGVAVHFSKCCYPIPGDQIVGILKPGQGMFLHTVVCSEFKNLENIQEKYLSVRWEDNIEKDFDVPVVVEIMNERGALANLTTAISETEGNITDIQLMKRSEQAPSILIFLSVRSRAHLAKIMKKIRQIQGVTKVTRFHNEEM